MQEYPDNAFGKQGKRLLGKSSRKHCLVVTLQDDIDV